RMQALADVESKIASAEEIGMRRGLEKGMEKGVKQGQASLLKRLLRQRFGDLPESIGQRLDAATPAELELWSECIFDAKNLEDIFA
ncbi:MAG: DUF4351 domain-containing protein, partial [Methylobacter sp.]